MSSRPRSGAARRPSSPPTWGYVGLLSAAALYGAAHHAPQAYQLVTDRQVRPITVGRSRLHFAYKRDAAYTATVRRKTETGTMAVSTPEATAFDLLRYVDLVGGVDAAATVLSELGEQLDPATLAAAAGHVPRTVAQRVGWLLDRVGHPDRTGLLHAALASQPRATVDLRPGFVTDAAPDPNWHVRVDRDVEVDT